MNWVTLSITAYFLIALEIILDKFLISSERVSHPAVYAFYSGILSLSAFFLFPFGFHMIPLGKIVLSFLAGVIFVYGILSLFLAIKHSEASQVTVVVGAVIPIITYFLSIFFLREHLGLLEIAGVVILILGGIWISVDLSQENAKKFFSGFYLSILTGVLLAFSYTLFKEFYEHDKFINVYIWTRVGVMLGAISLLFNRKWRSLILKSLLKFKKPDKENKSSGIIFLSNKILGGVGSITKEYATALGSVTIVNALVSTEYAFIFILGLLFSFWLPKVFREKLNIENVTQKLTAIIVIAIGLVLVSKFR